MPRKCKKDLEGVERLVVGTRDCVCAEAENHVGCNGADNKALIGPVAKLNILTRL